MKHSESESESDGRGGLRTLGNRRLRIIVFNAQGPGSECEPARCEPAQEVKNQRAADTLQGVLPVFCSAHHLLTVLRVHCHSSMSVMAGLETALCVISIPAIVGCAVVSLNIYHGEAQPPDIQGTDYLFFVVYALKNWHESIVQLTGLSLLGPPYMYIQRERSYKDSVHPVVPYWSKQ